MTKNFLLVVFRVILAVGVVYALPMSHMYWGNRYPGNDGQQAFGFIIMFFIIGFGAAIGFFVLGTLGQYWLNEKPARITLLSDLALFLVFSCVLIYGGVTATYEDDTKPMLIHAAPHAAQGNKDAADELAKITASN